MPDLRVCGALALLLVREWGSFQEITPIASDFRIKSPPSPCPIRTAPTTGMSRPPRLPRRPHDKIPLMHFLAFGR